MANSKNEVKEKRGKIALVIALLFAAIIIGGYFMSEKIIDQNAIIEDYEILEGNLVWNPTAFQSFYGIDDSVVNIYQDTIEHYIKNYKKENLSKAERAGIEEYILLKEMDLLFAPCHFLKINNEECRIYFSQEDDMKIREHDVINKGGGKIPFFKMKLLELDDKIYICDEILEINKR